MTSDDRLDDIEWNWRYDQMSEAVAAAKAAFSQPGSEAERRVGWTEDLAHQVKDWIDRCQLSLSESRHPSPTIVGSWGRWLMDAPGSAFDPGSCDGRKESLFRMDKAIHDVHELEDLYTQAANLMDLLTGRLPDEEVDNGWSAASCGIVAQHLLSLRQLISSGRRLANVDSELWRDGLAGSGARWQTGGGHAWTAGMPLPRFWVDQPGDRWTALGRIVRLFDAVTWSDSWDAADSEG